MHLANAWVGAAQMTVYIAQAQLHNQPYASTSFAIKTDSICNWQAVMPSLHHCSPKSNLSCLMYKEVTVC